MAGGGAADGSESGCGCGGAGIGGIGGDDTHGGDGFVEALVVVDAGEAEGAGAVAVGAVGFAGGGEGVGVEGLVFGEGEVLPVVEEVLVEAGGEVLAVALDDFAAEEGAHAAAAVGEEADAFAGEVLGAGFEEGEEAHVEGGGVGVADAAVVGEGGFDLGLEFFGAEVGVFAAGEVEVGFEAHAGEGEVVAEVGEVGKAGTAVVFVVFPGLFEGVKVDFDGVFAVDEGFVAVVGAPEVHDVLGEVADVGVDAEDFGVGGEDHGDGAAALGGFAGGAEAVAGDVGGDDEDFLFGVHGDGGEAEV